MVTAIRWDGRRHRSTAECRAVKHCYVRHRRNKRDDRTTRDGGWCCCGRGPIGQRDRGETANAKTMDRVYTNNSNNYYYNHYWQRVLTRDTQGNRGKSGRRTMGGCQLKTGREWNIYIKKKKQRNISPKHGSSLRAYTCVIHIYVL